MNDLTHFRPDRFPKLVRSLGGPLNGALSGLCATAPMTVTMLALHQLLPGHEQYPLPPYEITREATEKPGVVQAIRRLAAGGKTKSQHDRVAQALLAHFGFGAAAGAVYGLAGRAIAVAPGPPRGVVYGLIVWAANYLGLLPAAGLYRAPQREPLGRHAMMITAHVVWGAALGLLFQNLMGDGQSSQRARQQPTLPAGFGSNL